ncbi:MAG: hypothetical protein ACTSU5_19645 [Promethearchaeota archaeon]
MLLNNLWIIHQESGVCVFNEKFRDGAIDYDADMFSGFISAIITFSKEITAGKFQVKNISLGPLKISYRQAPYILISLCVDETTSKEEVERVIGEIADRFLEKYGDRLEPGKFNFDTLQFQDFSYELRDLAGQTSASGAGTSAVTGESTRTGDTGTNRGQTPELGKQLADAMSNFLDDSDDNTAFESLKSRVRERASSGGAGSRERVVNTLKIAKKFANSLLPELDFAPIFKELRRNIVDDEDDDYSF